LCGFPPFSDELNTRENPYTLAQQIRSARFDYPSPYWDSVGDPALDLIDKMLTVDPEKRATVEECLEHPWITKRTVDPATSMDSTSGLSNALQGLDFSKRKVARERTLLSSLNSVRVSKVVDDCKLKVWDKKPVEGNKKKDGHAGKGKADPPPQEETPDAHIGEQEFMNMGGKG
jgi:serine/threonine-protein kinase Chk2